MTNKKIITVDFRNAKEKLEDLKWNAKRKFREGLRWVSDNKELVITVMPVVVGCIVTVTKVVGKRINLQKEESLKNLYCYDRSLGHYWRLRRELSNKEWLEIDKRKKNGERLADILAELKVLK